jgi:hypothetical protein
VAGDRTPGNRAPVGSGLTEVVMPLSGAALQWRDADRAYRLLLAGDVEGRGAPWQRADGRGSMHIVADGEVWRSPSWLVAWGELPPGGEVAVLRTDRVVPVHVGPGLDLRVDRPR